MMSCETIHTHARCDVSRFTSGVPQNSRGYQSRKKSIAKLRPTTTDPCASVGGRGQRAGRAAGRLREGRRRPVLCPLPLCAPARPPPPTSIVSAAVPQMTAYTCPGGGEMVRGGGQARRGVGARAGKKSALLPLPSRPPTPPLHPSTPHPHPHPPPPLHPPPHTPLPAAPRPTTRCVASSCSHAGTTRPRQIAGTMISMDFGNTLGPQRGRVGCGGRRRACRLRAQLPLRPCSPLACPLMQSRAPGTLPEGAAPCSPRAGRACTRASCKAGRPRRERHRP
jgi:hypothetical protein